MSRGPPNSPAPSLEGNGCSGERWKLTLGRKRLATFSSDDILARHKIDDAYILCITLDHYPAVMHQLDVYLTKRVDDPFPVTISIFDLDILAFYLADPFEFAYYLRQRTALSAYYKAETEMSLLGMHLKQKPFKKTETDIEVVAAASHSW